MQELILPNTQGETIIYKEDPFDFGEISEGDIVLVEDFLPPPEYFILDESDTEGIEVIIDMDKLIPCPM